MGDGVTVGVRVGVGDGVLVGVRVGVGVGDSGGAALQQSIQVSYTVGVQVATDSQSGTIPSIK